MKLFRKTMWGGFSYGKLDEPLVDDFWTGHNERTIPSLYNTRKQARARYEDVRRIELKEVRRKQR